MESRNLDLQLSALFLSSPRVFLIKTQTTQHFLGFCSRLNILSRSFGSKATQAPDAYVMMTDTESTNLGQRACIKIYGFPSREEVWPHHTLLSDVDEHTH